MPRVAMNELTLKRTTSSPERKPTRPHAAIAISEETTALSSVFASSQVSTTSENASIAPTDRSNAPTTSGTRIAIARIAMTTWSAATSRNVTEVRKVSGIQTPKSTITKANR